jgi:integrase
MERVKARRGTVAVENVRDFLRLRWSYQGERHTLSLGLPDSKVNREVAESRAKIINGDLATGNFDPTLRKYKPQTATAVS